MGSISIDDYLQDVGSVARTIDRPVLVGHSLGGLLVLKMAEKMNPAALILVCPAPPRGIYGPPTREQLGFLVKHMPALLLGKPVVPSLAEARRTLLKRLPKREAVWVFRHGARASSRVLRELIWGRIAVDPTLVKCPILVISGTDDTICLPRVVSKLAARYGAEYREVPDAGHLLPLEPAGETAAVLMGSWLQSAVATD